VRSYSRSFLRRLHPGGGTELFDVHGKRYLDFLAGAGSLNYGHNNPLFKQALVDYIMDDGITHSLDLHSVAKERFLEVMHDVVLKPRGSAITSCSSPARPHQRGRGGTQDRPQGHGSQQRHLLHQRLSTACRWARWRSPATPTCAPPPAWR